MPGFLSEDGWLRHTGLDYGSFWCYSEWDWGYSNQFLVLKTDRSNKTICETDCPSVVKLLPITALDIRLNLSQFVVIPHEVRWTIQSLISLLWFRFVMRLVDSEPPLSNLLITSLSICKWGHSVLKPIFCGPSKYLHYSYSQIAFYY